MKRASARSRIFGLLAAGSLATALAAPAGPGRYLAADEFLEAAFDGRVPASAMLWIDGDLRESIETLLGHRFDALRVRYWREQSRSAWIFDEIGKERPITIGITVNAGAIETVRVLEFRETRGWEVRHAFFTDQFVGARLTSRDRIDRTVDGITGATLSVAAVTRIANLALLLHANTNPPHS